MSGVALATGVCELIGKHRSLAPTTHRKASPENLLRNPPVFPQVAQRFFEGTDGGRQVGFRMSR